MLNDPHTIQDTLAYYDGREAEMQRQLAHFEQHGPKRVYALLVRAFIKEQQQIAVRRRFLRGVIDAQKKERP